MSPENAHFVEHDKKHMHVQVKAVVSIDSVFKASARSFKALAMASYMQMLTGLSGFDTKIDKWHFIHQTKCSTLPNLNTTKNELKDNI